MKLKKIILLGLAAAILSTTCGCSQKVVSQEWVRHKYKLAYIYYTQEARTTAYGNITGYDRITNYGAVRKDGTVDNYQTSEEYDITLSDENSVVFHKLIKTCEDGSRYVSYSYPEFFVTEDVLKNIGGNIR